MYNIKQNLNNFIDYNTDQTILNTSIVINNELLIGIDFGTTNTIISKFLNNKILIINDGISNIIPSKIGINANKIFCGNYIPLDCEIIINNLITINTQKYKLNFIIKLKNTYIKW